MPQRARVGKVLGQFQAFHQLAIVRCWSWLRPWSTQSAKRGTPRRNVQQRSLPAVIQFLEPRQLLSGAPIAFAQPTTPVHSFYVDPANGSSSGDGSQAHPWQTLQQVFSAGLVNGQDSTQGVVHAGDTIYLMDGNQGSVYINSNAGGYNNTDYITIQAYPGAHPVINNLEMVNTTNWAFRGITFQNSAVVPAYNTLADFTNSTNLIFDNNTLYSQADVSGWTSTDWLNSTAYRAISFVGTNAEFSNNSISNVRFGIATSGNNIAITGNKIDGFAYDGIDFAASNVLIQNNTVTNHYAIPGDGNHNDGIQGWTPDGAPYTNITIDSNIVLVYTGTNPSVPTMPAGVDSDVMQGIFLTSFDNATVTNNVVGSSAYHGLALYNVSDALIANNTVIRQATDPSMRSWILAASSISGVPLQNVVVRNNIANMYNLDSVGVTDDHNISFASWNVWSNSATETYVVDPTQVFANYNPAGSNLNLQLSSASPAIGAGTSLNAPLTDVLDVARNLQSVDLGAYTFTVGTSTGGSTGSSGGSTGSTSPSTGSTDTPTGSGSTGTSPGTSVPVNHAPVGTSNTVTTLENQAYTFKLADFGFTDPNDTSPNSLLAVKITSLPTNGTLTLNGNPVTITYVSASDIAAGKLVFTPAANASGATYDNFTFRVQDNGGTANGGIDTDLTARTMTINVTWVNQAPVGTSNTVTVLENGSYVFKTTDFGFTDPGDNGANTLLAVKITSLPTNGTLTLNGIPVTITYISASDIAAGKLVFTPAANASGATYDNFTFRVQDNGGTANGGIDTDLTARTMTINVTWVNQAPVGTSNTVTMLENGTYTFKTADFGFTDPADNGANTLLGVKITSLPTNGTLTLNGVPVTVDYIKASDIAAGKLKFTPAQYATGAAYDNFTFRVQDNGGTANGGIDTDLIRRTMTIVVSWVNQAPIGASTTVTTKSNTAYTFKLTDFGFSDPNDSPANAFLGVLISSLPKNGKLTINGNQVKAGTFISAADIAAGKFKFTPGNMAAASTVNFGFRVQDNGGTANGGTSLSVATYTLTVLITK